MSTGDHAMGAKRDAKDALFEGFAAIGRALSSGRRIEIVDLLAQGPRSVEDVAAELHQSVANTSHHLRTLAAAGLLRTRRSGQRIYYSLASTHVEDLWRAVRTVAAEHVAEIDRLARDYLGDRGALEVVTRKELHRRLRAGEVTVVDVRPAAEFEAGHIPGAHSIPPDELRRRLGEVPRGGEVVAYCRGPYCVYADEAVRLLLREGVEAKRLEDGFPEWRRARLPVERGSESG